MVIKFRFIQFLCKNIVPTFKNRPVNIVIVSNEMQKAEILQQDIQPGVELTWQEEPVVIDNATGYIDLLFNRNAGSHPFEKVHSPVLVNAVETTLSKFPHFTRFNGWNSFLKNLVWEASGEELHKKDAEKMVASLGRKIEWVADIPGFISPRVICMIINEAYHALDENVSSKDEIDTAMKLGTNYPYGPFEWSNKIGLKKVVDLLHILSNNNKRYTPSSLLIKEASAEQ